MSYLARRLGIGVNALDAMIPGNEEAPRWVFLRAVEFVADAEASRAVPPGFPADWDGPQWTGA